MITFSLQSLNCKIHEISISCNLVTPADRPNIDADQWTLFLPTTSPSIAFSALFSTIFDIPQFHVTTPLDATSICVLNRSNGFVVTDHEDLHLSCGRPL